jgi:DNA-binding transcriptional MerR regulator
MNVSEVADWVGIAPSTIRKYLRDFGDVQGAFSRSATPDMGKHRRFTNRDVAVIAWISDQYNGNRLSTDAMRSALSDRLERNLPFEEPPRPEPDNALAVIPREQHEAVLKASERALQLALAERDAVRQMWESERKEVARLNREIGRLAEMIRGLGGEPGIHE